MRALWLLVGALLAVVAKRHVWTPRPMKDVRITSEKPARRGQFPHQALVLGDQMSVCGGSLITPTKVLTAAHCTVGYKEFLVVLGSVRLRAVERSAWRTETPWALAHPQYRRRATDHGNYDVAVVLLLEPAPLSRYIKPVALPSPLEVNNSFKGQRALISGWGRTSNNAGISDELQWTRVRVVSNELCSTYYDPGDILESTVCALEGYAGICSGDSGSALVLRTRRGYKQIGVANFVVDDGCGVSAPDAYARVTSVLGWITRVANDSA